MLLDLFPDELRWEEAADLERRGRAGRRLRAAALPGPRPRGVASRPARPRARGRPLLAEAALARGARSFGAGGRDSTGCWRASPSWPAAAPESGIAAPGPRRTCAAALREACEGRRSFAELREAGIWPSSLLGRLPRTAGRSWTGSRPERITLPGGRAVGVNYEAGDKPPWVESRLQDFFGSVRGRRWPAARVPLVLHLLAPNMRAVQVTTDLAGFWERHYPAIRRELMRRYPRHAWPEDPRTARAAGAARAAVSAPGGPGASTRQRPDRARRHREVEAGGGDDERVEHLVVAEDPRERDRAVGSRR